MTPTFKLLSSSPDAAVAAWGQEFDWTRPIVSSVAVDGVWVDRHDSAAELLLAHGDRRLLDLLIRSDMFDMPTQASSRQSVRNKTSPRGLPFGTRELWRGLWCCALQQGDLDMARLLQSRAANHLSFSVSAHDAHDLRPILDAVGNIKSKAVLGRVWGYLLDEAADLFIGSAGSPRSRTAMVEKAMDHGFGPVAIRVLLSVWGDRPTPKMLGSALAKNISSSVNDLKIAMEVLRAASDHGFSLSASDGQIWLNKSDWTGSRELVHPMERFIDRLARSKVPSPTFVALAQQVLDWPETSRLSIPKPVRATELLSLRVGDWTPLLFEAVRTFNPTPSPKEVARLMLGAPDEMYASRVLDFLGTEHAALARGWTDLFSCLEQSVKDRDSIRTKGFDRLWKRAASLVQSLPESQRGPVDEGFRNAARNMYEDPELRKRMLSVYDQARMEMATAPEAPSTSRRGVRL